MTEKKERKPWQDTAFREPDNKALIEHAKSLGGKMAVERRLKSIEKQRAGAAFRCAGPPVILSWQFGTAQGYPF